MTDRVELRLSGRMLEKFIGRAILEGIFIQRAERIGPGEMYIAASGQDAERLLRMAEEYGLMLSVTGEMGRPLFLRRVKERGTLAAGLLLSVLLLIVFTSCIWSVRAVPLDDAAAGMLAEVERCAKALGARPGAVRSSMDREALAAGILAQCPELTHVSVQLNGVYLSIEVAVEQPAPEVYDILAGRDLVASRDAVVVYVEPLAGKACVAAGDTVRRGQVLIRGEERIDDQVMRDIRAAGQVVGRVWFTESCSLPMDQTTRTRTGNRRVSAKIQMGKWSLSLSEAEDYPCQEIEEEYLPIGGLFLPIRIARTVRWEAEEKTVPLDRTNLEKQGEAWALELARGKIPAGAEETAGWVEFSENEKMLIVKATVEVQMNIAVEGLRPMHSEDE